MSAGGWELASSIATVILSLCAVVRWIYVRVVRPLHQVAELLRGDEQHPGLERWQQQVDQHLARQDQHMAEQDGRLQSIEDELHPNGGSSTYDELRACISAVADQVGAQLPPSRKQRRRRGGAL